MLNNNSKLVLDYMIENDYNPENSKGTLELFQSVHNSLSIYLKNYEQLLLSEKVDYNDLKKYNINGLYGYLENRQIVVPKCFKNDQYMINTGINVKDKFYKIPYISEYDTIIFYDLWDIVDTKRVLQLAYYDKFKRFFGFLYDIDDENIRKNLKIMSLFLKYLNCSSEKEFELLHDRLSDKNKEIFLIKEKTKKLYKI